MEVLFKYVRNTNTAFSANIFLRFQDCRHNFPSYSDHFEWITGQLSDDTYRLLPTNQL